jgi:hypothetical protein
MSAKIVVQMTKTSKSALHNDHYNAAVREIVAAGEPLFLH